MTDIEILKEGIKALDSKKADDIRILKVRDLTILANYFVIVSGSSSTQVKALADEVDFKLGEKGEEPKVQRSHKVGTQRSGTGDIFTAIIAADAVNGVPFPQSVKKASHFIKKCIERSVELEIPLTDGVCFEEVLYTLKA